MSDNQVNQVCQVFCYMSSYNEQLTLSGFATDINRSSREDSETIFKPGDYSFKKHWQCGSSLTYCKAHPLPPKGALSQWKCFASIVIFKTDGQ